MKILLIGAGKLGKKVLDVLSESGIYITVLDKNEETVKDVSDKYEVDVALGNAKRKTILEGINIASFDYTIVLTDNDEKNIFIAHLAKKLGTKKTIIRIREPEHSNQLPYIKEYFEIDKIVNPDYSVALEMKNYITKKYAFENGLYENTDFKIAEFYLYEKKNFYGKTLKEIDDDIKPLNLIAYSINGKFILANLKENKDYIFNKNDEIDVYIGGKKSDVDSFYKDIKKHSNKTSIRNVLIAGGGKTAFYASSMLNDEKVSVKIIEENKERCKYLSSYLDKDVLIINANPNNINILKEEGLENADSFIGATSFDEDNLLISLLAKQAGVEDVITKTSMENYSSLVDQIGIDMIYNPVNISAGRIAFILGESNILSNIVIQGQAELLEINVTKNLSVAKKKIKDLGMNSNIKVIAIFRDNKLVDLSDDTLILEKDRLLLLGLLSETGKVEKLIRKKSLF